ncbi:hypothetical protein ACG02S_24285 [Roseateles sp. DC23W]|uniref:Chain length determinant protein n=1 Tax=Pelomonas dachongensis TaxID=3299029 RepID=A0ABW7EWK9_9BURK
MKRIGWRFGTALFALPIGAALLTAVACVLFIAPVYTARLSLALQAPPGKLPMYGALLQSRRLADRAIDHFALQALWGERTRADARERLARSVRVGSDKGGLLVVEVDAPLPWLAADLAAFHLQELQALLDTMRAEAAAERRARLADALRSAQSGAIEARQALARSGIDEASLASDLHFIGAQWQALHQTLRQAQARLAALAVRFAPASAPYQAEAARVTALREQLARLEAARAPAPAHYAMAWREQQRQERLLTRLRLADDQLQQDAGRREEALLVVDRASLPERAGRPYALLLIVAAWAGTVAALLAWRRIRSPGRPAAARPSTSPA